MELKAADYKYQQLDDFAATNGEESSDRSKLLGAYGLDDNENESYLPPEVDGEEEPEDHLKKGLTICTASLFIIGEICGAGALAFPMGLSKSGLYGLIIIALVCAMSTYCGLLLAQCWVKIKETRVDMGPIRDPFPYIGEVSVGVWMRNAVTICLNTQLFLTCVVYLLLAAEIISTFISFHIGPIHSEADLRIWCLLIALIIFPFMLLGTPKDFWFVALAAASSTAVGLILVWVKYFLIHKENNGATVPKMQVTMSSISSAFGTFVFGFTGASLFPTIQSDMKNPSKFSKSIYIGYFGISMLYVPTAIGGYAVLGSQIQDSVLKTLAHYDIVHGTSRVIVSVSECLFAGHFLSGFVLMINPFLQQFEEYMKIPYEFTWKRVVARGAVLLAVLTTAEIFPRFGPIVDLVGGSINVGICFIFPIWFYLKLFPERKISEKVLLAAIVTIGVLGGICSTVSNVNNVIDTFHVLYAKKVHNATNLAT